MAAADSASTIAFCLRMIFSENRCTLFRIMRNRGSARDGARARPDAVPNR
jgi:hypothetical protein